LLFCTNIHSVAEPQESIILNLSQWKRGDRIEAGNIGEHLYSPHPRCYLTQFKISSAKDLDRNGDEIGAEFKADRNILTPTCL